MKSDHYYFDGDRVIFTSAFHIERGSCCGNGCRHCPYEPRATRGNIILQPQYAMKKALYLDDVRTPTDTIPNYQPWVVVRNFEQFTDYITQNGIPDLISFDHDLASEHVDDYFKQFAEKGYQHPDYETYKEKTGLHCATWLVEYSQKNNAPIKSVSVHSHNPVGAKNIQDCINSWKKYCDLPQDCYIGRHPFTVEPK